MFNDTRIQIVIALAVPVKIAETREFEDSDLDTSFLKNFRSWIQ
jgi:hypothetical protein